VPAERGLAGLLVGCPLRAFPAIRGPERYLACLVGRVSSSVRHRLDLKKGHGFYDSGTPYLEVRRATNFDPLAKILLRLGCTNAMNLDFGPSAALFVRVTIARAISQKGACLCTPPRDR
jgi:hypothetical protein